MADLFHSVEELSSIDNSVHLALGVFDGVHVGHQVVIESAIDAAKVSHGSAGVLTFSPHPIQVLAPERAPRRILASIQSKQRLVGKQGCDFMLVQRFTLEFAKCSAKEFVESIVRSCKQLKSLSVGEDWVFGKGREGNVHSLRAWGKEYGFEVYAIAPVMSDGERVSSTRIRQAIRDGNLMTIQEMLGRPYMVRGEVLHGRELARTLGFPTANIKVFNEQLPPDGVWAVEVRIDGDWVKGIGNLGKRPTVEDDQSAQRLLEVHLFDFNNDLYGVELEVRFISYVREEKRFSGVDALKAQIEKDVVFVQREVFS